MPLAPCDICGKEKNVPPSRMKDRARHFCSRACLGKWRAQQTGELAANWKGGVAKGRRIRVYKPDHPAANAKGYVWRSWLVAEEKIGRYLLPGEVVHHKDEDKHNDDPDNLEVFASQAEHARYHASLLPPEAIARMYTSSPNWIKKHGEAA